CAPAQIGIMDTFLAEVASGSYATVTCDASGNATSIDASSDGLKSVGTDISALTSLTNLNLSDNQLTSFSSTLPPSLPNLYLGSNKLTSFSSTLPATLTNLY